MKTIVTFECLQIGARFEFNAAMYTKTCEQRATAERDNESCLFWKHARTISESTNRAKKASTK